jgi:hypothetical protein
VRLLGPTEWWGEVSCSVCVKLPVPVWPVQTSLSFLLAAPDTGSFGAIGGAPLQVCCDSPPPPTAFSSQMARVFVMLNAQHPYVCWAYQLPGVVRQAGCHPVEQT